MDLGHFLLHRSADSLPHHIRECITVNVLTVTKKIGLCANGPFWTLFSLIKHHFIAKAAGREKYVCVFLNYDTCEKVFFY